MASYIFLLVCFSQLSVLISGCYQNRGQKAQCTSSICFSHFYDLKEGSVESFNCENTTSLTVSECENILKTSKLDHDSLCIHDDSETHCCCLPNDSDSEYLSICGAEHRNDKEYLGLLKGYKFFYLICAFLLCNLCCFCLFLAYLKLSDHWRNDNIPVPPRSALHMVSYGSIIVLGLLSFSLYFPFVETCTDHPMGVFRTPRRFLYSVFESQTFCAMYFALGVVLMLFEMGFLVVIKLTKTVNKPGASMVLLVLLLLVIIATYDPISSTADLSKRDNQYCARNVVCRLVVSHILYLIYAILLTVRIWGLYKLQVEKSIIDEESMNSVKSEHVPTIIASHSGQTYIESDCSEMLQVRPRPFHVSTNGISTLKVKNNHYTNWVALRALLSTTGFYKLHPSKFLIPPGMEISIDVEQVLKTDFPPSHHNILMEWFLLGPEPPNMDVKTIWSKPYFVPQNQWQFFVLPIYLEESTATADSSGSKMEAE